MEQEMHLFQKILQKTHIENDLSFPTEMLRFFQIPQETHRIAFEAVDYATGSVWPFQISTRLTGLYRKPVILRSSWHPFVAQKGLVVGDKVMFYLVPDEANELMKIRVRAQRSIITLFGKDCWIDVENLHLYGL